MRHAGTVDLGVDVADKIGLQVQVLNQGQRVVGIGFGSVLPENFAGVVTAQFRFEFVAE